MVMVLVLFGLLLLLLLEKVVTECRGSVPAGGEHERGGWVGVGRALGVEVGYTCALLADEGHGIVVVEGRGGGERER